METRAEVSKLTRTSALGRFLPVVATVGFPTGQPAMLSRTARFGLELTHFERLNHD